MGVLPSLASLLGLLSEEQLLALIEYIKSLGSDDKSSVESR